LVGLGAKAVIVDLDAAKGEALAKELGAVFVKTDVTSAEQVAAAVEQASKLGAFRIAVNCAGIGAAARTLGKDGSPHDLGLFQKVIAINLIGTFNVLRLFTEQLLRQPPVGEERGVIINTASVAAFDGQIGQVAYSASKGGVVGMTLPVARDLAQHLIRVNTIAPGLFLTPLLMGLNEEARKSLGAQVPHPARLGDASEYGALAVHIVENAMLNGETIRLDGAIRMAPR
jgi:NAD(P)-dependent dehydrogenase (short-subunit alcohol dehydrogenase family)